MLLSFIGVLLILIIALFVILNFYINSDALKARAVALVAENTGRSLVVDGDISLSLFPQIALKVGPARISNPPDFSKGDFASIKSMTATLDLKELLSKKIRITSLYIDGLTIQLLKNKSGARNWAFTAPHSPSASQKTKQGQTPAASAQQDTKTFPGFLAALNLDKVDLADARLHFKDASSDAAMAAEAVHMEIRDFGLGRQSRIALQADVLVPKNNTRIPISCSSPVRIAKNGAFEISALAGRIENTNFNGHIKGFPGTSYEIDAELTLDDLDLNTYLSFIRGNGVKGEAAAPANGASTNASESGDPCAPPSVPRKRMAEHIDEKNSDDFHDLKEFLEHYAIRLNLALRSLTVDALRVENIKAQVDGRDGVIRLKPFDCLLFKGTLGGEAALDVRAQSPKASMNLTLLGADTGECVQFLSGKREITGTLDATLNISASGRAREEFERTLSGTMGASSRNGVISALKLLPQAKLNGEYRRCSFSAAGKNGRFSSSDILLDANSVSATGHGWVELPKRELDATIRIEVPKLSIIPVRISGNFDALKVKMDTATTITSTILNIGTRLQKREKRRESGTTGQNETKKERILEDMLLRMLQ